MCDESLKEYISEYRNANTTKDKVSICNKYKDISWWIRIGMEAWEENSGYALIKHEIDGVGKVNIAISLDIALVGTNYRVGALMCGRLIEKLECELMVISQI